MPGVLVANRGEIACRIIRACQNLGWRSVAVYSEADAGSLHARMADSAFPVGPAPAAKSYLDADAILEAARLSGAEAIHPGYGFLSENAGFARRVVAAGLKWVGPAPETIEAMGHKQRAREIAAAAGVPVLPGSGRIGADDDFAAIAAAAAKIGFPLLVKAAGGGGGIGMRRVDDEKALEAAVATARQMGGRLFGNAELYLERFVAVGRHIEIQVFGDGAGAAWSLHERDCSLQRRFQKIVEEAPAPGLPEKTRAAMSEAALRLARAQNYAGAGTVEFLFDTASGDFYFLEMNTRIQVEHPVTEMVTGWDLVAAQLRLAFGLFEAPPGDVPLAGAAMECRIYAERPEKGFLPSPGTLSACDLPAGIDGVRIDTGCETGTVITPFYDPMIAKLIVRGSDRADAHRRMLAALDLCRIEGIHTNLGFLRRLMRQDDVAAGRLDTGLVERELKSLAIAPA